MQVNNSYLSPKQGTLSGFLGDKTFTGLFADGLHIGKHVVEYPPGYTGALGGVKLPVSVPELLGAVDDDDGGEGKWIGKRMNEEYIDGSERGRL